MNWIPTKRETWGGTIEGWGGDLDGWGGLTLEGIGG